MILGKLAILQRIEAGLLKIAPFRIECVQPASYDLHLGDHWSAITNPQTIGIDSLPEYAEQISTSYVLGPQQCVLALTEEYLELPADLAAKIHDKSSLARCFLNVTGGNAGWIDPGFRGKLVLEIINHGSCPIELYAGMRIGQIVFERVMLVDGELERVGPVLDLQTRYAGAYQNQLTTAYPSWQRQMKKLYREAVERSA